MSGNSELLWIAIPGGFKIRQQDQSREAILRVLIMPRLLGTSLRDEGMEHWPPPQLVKGSLTIEFHKDVNDAVNTFFIDPPHIQAQPGLWEAFFKPDTIITPAARRGEAISDVQVSDTSSDAADISTTFRTVAKTRVTEDSSSELEAAVLDELKTRWSNNRRRVPVSPVTSTPRTTPPLDFHRILGLLREHPAALRALGLIIELHLPESRLREEHFPAEGLLRVGWPGAPGETALPAIVSPWTQFGSTFLPASTRNISAGMVTLTEDREDIPNDGTRWEVVTVDVDGDAARLRDAARALMSSEGEPSFAAHPENATLPALRTAGLLLVRRGRQQDFTTRRQVAESNARLGSMSEAVLTADDLVLGYRLDISRSSHKWRSLHEREATYSIGEGPERVVIGTPNTREEGHIKAHAAIDQGDGQLRTDEVVARWSGWSLAVAPPALDTRLGRARPARRPGLPFHFDWQFSVPKRSLPFLRFTSSYRIRARIVDLAGGGLALDDPGADRCATTEIRYRRFEPISSPDLTLPDGLASNALGPGESVDQIVIRSDGEGIDAFLRENPLYTSNPSRRLSAPRVPLTLAEQHGMFDKTTDIDDLTRDKQTWSWIARAMESADEGALFPDPAAGGVCAYLRTEPGGFSARRVSRSWNEPWPELQPKGIKLVERQADSPGTSNPLVWVEDSEGLDQLEVRLAKAEQVTLEISSSIQDDFPDHFAIQDPDTQTPLESQDAAKFGRHPMVTPARTLTLVHAVRRPINEPLGTLIPEERQPGETFTILKPDPGMLNLDPNSTAQLELTAGWTERNDDVAQEVAGTPVQTVIVNRGDQQLKDTLRHEFGDTRHRMVSYTLTAVGRFRRFFHKDENPEAFLAKTPLAAVNIPSSARPAPPVVLSVIPTFRWEQEDLGSPDFEGFMIRRRRVAGLRAELQRPWFQTGEGEMLAVVVSKDSEPLPQLQPFLTQVGRDPIWETSIPNHWTTAQEIVTAAAEPVELFLEEAETMVMAVPHEAWFHDGRWYADIALPSVAESSYSPFIQLAVARYQPHSIPKLELSKVVPTEMVPLLPERSLVLDTQTVGFGGFINVTLKGRGPVGPRENRVDVIVEQCQLSQGISASAVDLTAPDESAAGGFPAWVARGSLSGNLGSTLQVELPSAEAGPLRVRVREVERIGPEGVEPVVPAGSEAELNERTVFTDVFLL